MEPIAGWHEEHDNFEQLLELLEDEVAAFHRGDTPNTELMSDIVSYLRAYSDCIHHRREDVAFKRLVRRDPGLELVINRLLQEHRVIAYAGEELLEALDQSLAGELVPRERIESAAATYLAYYRNHIATEELKVMPRAALVLEPEDWAAVIAAVPASPDPLFGSDIATRYRRLRQQIMRSARGTAAH